MYIALFGSIIFHSMLVIALFHNFPKLEADRKTIPFQLVSNSQNGSQNSASLSKAENTLAAQEFLRTLNEASFEQLIRQNTQKPSRSKDSPSPFKSDLPVEIETLESPIIFKTHNPSKSLQGLQELFRPSKQSAQQATNVDQISTENLELMSKYELELLKKLTQGKLYDEFHPAMQKYQQDSVKFELTLHLHSSGAIRNASISKSSEINEIDNLAIRAAYSASPYPIPPQEDLARGYKYTIPIKYLKQ